MDRACLVWSGINFMKINMLLCGKFKWKTHQKVPKNWVFLASFADFWTIFSHILPVFCHFHAASVRKKLHNNHISNFEHPLFSGAKFIGWWSWPKKLHQWDLDYFFASDFATQIIPSKNYGMQLVIIGSNKVDVGNTTK